MIQQDAGVHVTTGGADMEYVIDDGESTAGNDQLLRLLGSAGARASIDASGGDISLGIAYGPTSVVGGCDRVILLSSADIKISGNGVITIVGDGTANINTGNVWALQTSDAVIQSESGAINLALTGGANSVNSRGLGIDGGAFKVLSESGAISIRDLQSTTNNQQGLPETTLDFTSFRLAAGTL